MFRDAPSLRESMRSETGACLIKHVEMMVRYSNLSSAKPFLG
jgi:hypothetical protein